MRPVADPGDPAGFVPYEAEGGSYFSSVTKKLLWANGICFLATFLLTRFAPEVGAPLYDWLALAPDTWYGGFPALWQLVTYGFLHALGSPTHLLFNLLALYFFGTMLEGMVGPRRFAVQYFAALAFGGVVHLLAALAMAGHPPVVGASGAVLYTVIACAVLQPNARVLFFFVPLQLKIMALILVGLDLFSLLGRDQRTASDVHLAGAALGFLAAKLGWVWFDPVAWWERRAEHRAQEAQVSDEARLDQLLDRIHREGIHALSQREKDFLARMSKRR